MRIEYISHSCFVIESEQIKIAFDPWITGTAYQKQWYLFPEPMDIKQVEQADLILISHGHEDHLHHKSLQLIQKSAHVFFPFQWREGIIEYLKHIGFNDVTEAMSFKTYEYKGVKITYLGYSLESVIVVECDGYVIVNINDALNSNHETATDFLLQKIKTMWPKIDFLLSGWSGAGYFPNKVRYKNKNDREVGQIREQYFADNFCKFTKYLQPDISIPFAPGFVLLSDENRWINHVKFPRQAVERYYADNFENKTHIRFPVIYPGDYFTDKVFHKKSLYHQAKDDDEIYSNLDEIFSKEIVAANTIEYMDDEYIDALSNKLSTWIDKNKSLYHANVIEDAVFSICFKDVKQNNFFNVSWKDKKPVVARSNSSHEKDRLIITTQANLLSLNLDKMWGEIFYPSVTE